MLCANRACIPRDPIPFTTVSLRVLLDNTISFVRIGCYVSGILVRPTGVATVFGYVVCFSPVAHMVFCCEVQFVPSAECALQRTLTSALLSGFCWSRRRRRKRFSPGALSPMATSYGRYYWMEICTIHLCIGATNVLLMYVRFRNWKMTTDDACDALGVRIGRGHLSNYDVI